MIDFTKPVQTRDGRKVEIYSTDNGGVYPVHGRMYSITEDAWGVGTWTETGAKFANERSGMDLINVKEKEKKQRWANVYRQGDSYYIGRTYLSRDAAQVRRADNESYVATIPIEFED